MIVVTASWQSGAIASPLPPGTLANPQPPPKLSMAVWSAMLNNRGAGVDVIVTMPGNADLTSARGLGSKQAKTLYVYNAVTDYANKAQSSVRRELSVRGIPYRVLWLINGIAVNGMDQATLTWLAQRNDVAHIDLDVKSSGLQANAAVETKQIFRWFDAAPSMLAQTNEWGIARVNAPQVWAAGYTGQGIVIADLDTGVLWDHAALIGQYRGSNDISATHNYNWFDPTGESVDSPSDDEGHGTHTTGTIVGYDGASVHIGVAPGSQWIACRNMAQGYGSVSLYTACFQFALAPTDTNGDSALPELAADITSNSWTCWGGPPWYEVGCSLPSALLTATQVLREAGIMVVAAAGNEGPSCGTVGYSPGTYAEALSVGAINSSNTIASFSSRGASTFNGGIKPDVVAPGVGVLSSLNTVNKNQYGQLSGTSMATPHVAGVVALLWSAAHWLRGDIDETEAILTTTAQAMTSSETCNGVPGSSVPNNTFGYGLVDAQAAVNEARAVVTQASIPALNRQLTPLTLTYHVTNTSSLTRTNVVLTASMPVSTQFAPIGAASILSESRLLTWTVASLQPGQTYSYSIVITPTLSGIITSSYGVSYDGIVHRRQAISDGLTLSSFIYATQIRLLFVMRK